MDFLGRERDLTRLESILDQVTETGRGALLAMRGRRRVGKSRLAEEFAQRSGCPYVYFTAVQQSGGAELDRFVEELARSRAPRAADVAAGLRPQTWEAALELAAEGATAEQPLILIVDELPYLADKDPSIEAVLQKVWDRSLQAAPVLVLLIGSDEAMMRALGEQGRPLYDRLREMVVQPLSPVAVGKLLDLAPADALEAQLVIGGFPVLALEWGAGRSRAEYLQDALTDPTSFLIVSAERTLSAEFPAPSSRAVLAAIGTGARAHSAILGRTNLSATAVNDTLAALQARGVVQRLTPYSTKSARKTVLWEIADPYMRFWLRFVAGNIDLVERGRGALLMETVERDWPAYRGRAIEHLVREAIELLLPDEERFGAARHVGGYWNRTGAVEIDLVGGDTTPVARQIGFVGSIKWRESRVFDRADALELAKRRDDVPGAGAETPLVGVSSQGFSDDAPLDVRLAPEDLIAAYDAGVSAS